MKISSLDRTVSDLLKDFYFIPRFQRPYSWEREQVEQFWVDTIVENQSDYFIGSIVLFKQGNQLGLVDGQQRFTTIILLLCALRNAFRDDHLEEQEVGLQALIERTDLDNRKQFVLQTESSHPYLQDRILSNKQPRMTEKASPEEKLLAETFNLLSDRIRTAQKEWPGPELSRRKDVLMKIRDRILGLTVIAVQLENEDDAYLIFETLNTRGKDLQVSHLVKNHLSRLLKADNKSLDHLKIGWDELLRTFERSQVRVDVDTYLLHHWLSTQGFVSSKKLFRAMKNSITQQTAEASLKSLIVDAREYRKIVEFDYEFERVDRQIRESLRAISLVFRMQQPFPLLLSLMRCFRDKKLTRKNVESVLRLVESFHFKFTAVAARSSSGGVSAMYAAWARRFSDASTETEQQAVIKDVKGRLREREPGKEEFVAGFVALRNSEDETRNRRLVKYVLTRIERHQDAHAPPVDYEAVTIEHIAPQNPDAASNISKDHVAMIGNQVLCGMHLQNKLGNRGFAAKRATLSQLSGAKDIAKLEEWGERQIEQRTHELAELAYDTIWKL